MDVLKQREILNHIAPDFARDGQEDFIGEEKRKILKFVEAYSESAKAKGYVIGVSGGVDSFLVGALLAESCARSGRELIALLLPNGEQKDISDAEECARRMTEICPAAKVETVNIRPVYEASVGVLEAGNLFHPDPYSLGNLQPRIRMLIQYAFARGMLVAGTDQASEAVTGFYTKYGDGGTDFNPIGQMIKDDIYDLSARMGAPDSVLRKQPAAGLGISEDDESELRLSYKDICAYLKGYPISDAAEARLIQLYDASAHKRALPPTPAWLSRREDCATHIHVGDADCEAAVRRMNEHPEEAVLYADVSDTKPFLDGVNKTVNTPIARYNCFFGGEDPKNEQFGSIFENVRGRAVISGDARKAAPLAEAFNKAGREARILF